MEHLETYREASWTIRHHTNRLSFFLGRRAAWYTGVYDISEMGDFESEIRERAGVEAPSWRSNRSPSQQADPLTPDLIAVIQEMYAEDYEIFGNYFRKAPPAVQQQTSPPEQPASAPLFK